MSPRLALALALALASLSCNRFEDCKCAGPEYGLGTLPATGSTDVPTNTRIWGSAILDLQDGAGVSVPTTRSTVTDSEDFSEFTVLRPVNELQPNTTYTITAATSAPHTFTTGAGPHTTPPPIPEIEDLEQVRDHDCGQSLYHATYTLRGPASIYLLDTAETTTFVPADLVGDVTAYSHAPQFDLGARCGGYENVPAAPTRNTSTTVRFAALDLAGNFSGWSEPEELTFSGCKLGGRSSPALLGLLPLLIARRRRATAARLRDPQPRSRA